MSNNIADLTLQTSFSKPKSLSSTLLFNLMNHVNSVSHTTLHSAQIWLKLANNFRNSWLESGRQLRSMSAHILFPWEKAKAMLYF